MEYITFHDASAALGCTVHTIRMAVQRGNLTRVQKVTKQGYLAKGQVDLFVGKKQIRKSLLSDEELKQWIHYDDVLNGNSAPQEASVKQASQSDTININELASLIASQIKPNVTVTYGVPSGVDNTTPNFFTSEELASMQKGLNNASPVMLLGLGLMLLLVLVLNWLESRVDTSTANQIEATKQKLEHARNKEEEELAIEEAQRILKEHNIMIAA